MQRSHQTGPTGVNMDPAQKQTSPRQKRTPNTIRHSQCSYHHSQCSSHMTKSDVSASHNISTSLNVRDPCRTRKKNQKSSWYDSIPKYVDGEDFFGKQKTAIITLGTATQAVHAIKQWSKEGSVTSFIAHLGVNDIHDSTHVAELSDNRVSLMKTAAGKYPRATIAFSEIQGAG